MDVCQDPPKKRGFFLSGTKALCVLAPAPTAGLPRPESPAPPTSPGLALDHRYRLTYQPSTNVSFDPTMSPQLPRYSTSPVPEPLGSRGPSRKATTDGADAPFGRSESAPALLPYSSLSAKGRPSSPRTQLYLQPDAYGSLDRSPSPRPRAFDGAGSPHGRAPSPRPGPLRQQGPPTPFDFLGRAGSPRGSPLAEGPQAFFPERGPSPRPGTTAYDAPAAFGSPLLGAGGSAFAPPLRAQGEPRGFTWRVRGVQSPGPASLPLLPPGILMSNFSPRRPNAAPAAPQSLERVRPGRGL